LKYEALCAEYFKAPSQVRDFTDVFCIKFFRKLKKRRNLQILEKFFTNSTKIKFVNFVGNYSYKVKNIEKINFASCKVFTVLVRKIQFSCA
jgi:hypothetical protein